MCDICRLNHIEDDFGLFHPVAANSSGVGIFETEFVLSHQANILALVAGTKWDANAITYSFPDSTLDYTGSPGSYGSGELANGFGSLGAAQQDAANRALDLVSQYTPLVFTEYTANEGTADLRIASSSQPATAWAYYPSGSSLGGDAWFNSATGYYSNTKVGTYANHTFMHEIGHTLGLKHGHDASGYGALSSDMDQMSYSVMTYRSYEGAVGANYTNEYYGYAQSYMMYDIAALQALYGVNWEHNAGDTTYRWSETSGEMFVDDVGQGRPGSNRIFQTIWDGDGVDTLDLSNYNGGMTLDLNPGGGLDFSSIQKVQLTSGTYAEANVFMALAPDNKRQALLENAIAGNGNDTILGNRGHNVLNGGAKKDEIFGGGGHDTLIGGSGRDRLIGGPGDDIIEGGVGRDFLKGSGGSDTFVFDSNSGKDVLAQFRVGEDFLDLPDAHLATFGTSNTGHLTVIHTGGEIILRGYTMADGLTIDDLIA